MRISSEWLQDFVPVPAPNDLAHLFEMAGLGVEDQDGDRFTLEVTSNRGDCLSAIGIAREVAAMTDKKLRVPKITLDEPDNLPPSATVEIENNDDCPRYAARLLDSVELGPSPDWIQERLLACGMRPLNVVVDVTNYVMLETGQPLHAFDADKVADRHIIVRRAREGEKLTTLDDVERELNPEVLVIADREKPIALAGVMGGANSEVTSETRRILLESANFNASRVRRGGRALDIGSEARRRFERNIDPNGVRRALDRATQMLMQFANAQIAGSLVDAYARPQSPAKIALRIARSNAILGLKLSSQNITEVLERLQFTVEAGEEGTLQVTVPTFRRDITREIDLIEEVARIYGYDKVPTSLPRGVNPVAGRSLSQRLEEKAKSAVLRCGVSEVVTLSMTNEAANERAGLGGREAVRLRNPLSEDFTQLRTSLIPGLLEVLSKNARNGARIFELGRIYLPQEGQQLPNECRRLAIALADPQTARPHWQKAAPKIDFFTLRGVVETAVCEVGVPRVAFRQATRPPFHPGRCAVISIDSQDIGVMGEVHPEISARYGLSQRAYVANIDFDVLARHLDLLKPYTPIGRFPTADRDLALVLPANVAAGRVQSVLRKNGGDLLREVEVFDVYTGPPIPEGFKSLTLALRFQADDRTLTDEEVEAAMLQLRSLAQSELGATLR